VPTILRCMEFSEKVRVVEKVPTRGGVVYMGGSALGSAQVMGGMRTSYVVEKAKKWGKRDRSRWDYGSICKEEGRN